MSALREGLRAALAARARRRLRVPGFRDAAVLLPLVARGSDAAVIFTVRPDAMPTHGGQVSFPGGGRRGDDADLRATALREAREELGIAPAAVEVLGQLDDEGTPLGFVIRPVVGWLADEPALAPDPREVAATFAATLAELRDPAVFQDGAPRLFRGRWFAMPEYHVGPHRIWGATARMLRQLLELAPRA